MLLLDDSISPRGYDTKSVECELRREAALMIGDVQK